MFRTYLKTFYGESRAVGRQTAGCVRRARFSIALATALLAGSAQSADWTETFKQAFHSASGANHMGIAAHGHRAILAGKYAIDMLSYDPSDDSWNLDFRINENSAGGLVGGIPAVAIDGTRAAYARLKPGTRSTWEIRARFHHHQPNQWSTLITGIPGRVTSLAFANQTRVAVGYDADSSWGARIYEYNGSGFQHVATMQLGLAQSHTGLTATIDGDWAVAYALESGTSAHQAWLVVYRRYGPGNWQFHQAITLPSAGLALSMDDDLLAVGMPFDGTGEVAVYRRQGVLDLYQLEQTLTSPSAWGADSFGFDVEIDDDEIYVADYAETFPGRANFNNGAIHRFTHEDGSWTPGTRFVSSQGASGEAVGLFLSVTTQRILATGSQNNGTLYSFKRPWVWPIVWLP